MTIETPPEFPAGPFQTPEQFDESLKNELVERLQTGPNRIRDLVTDLDQQHSKPNIAIGPFGKSCIILRMLISMGMCDFVGL